MNCVVIKGPSIQEAYAQIQQALSFAKLVELRLDLFHSLDLSRLRQSFTIPMIFTIKNKEHIQELLQFKPEYIDLDRDIAREIPETKLIISYHNYEDTPHDLSKIYQCMRKIPAFYYKIAVTAKNSVDALRLCYLKKSDLIAISMGDYGQLSRYLSPINYLALDENQKTAPGQFTLQNYVNSHKDLYGLIGNPVDQSISDKTHNGLIPGIYVKMAVKPTELSQFLNYAKQLNFRGLSVTMPLKEVILPLLDEVDPDLPSVNTLVFKEGRIYGYNTDGKGALKAIGIPVSNKHIILIGAGGAAKAIALEAKRQQAHVTMLKRKDSFPKEPYDILINCTPSESPISPEFIMPDSIVMDIKTKPQETEFLRQAKIKGCKIIYGYQMFIEQALGQFQLWFPKMDMGKTRTSLEKKVIESLQGINYEKKSPYEFPKGQLSFSRNSSTQTSIYCRKS